MLDSSRMRCPLACLSLGLSLGVACSPQTNKAQVTPSAARTEAAPRTESAVRSEDAARSETSPRGARPRAEGEATDRQSCGLPAELRTRNWPRNLTPTSAEDPFPSRPGGTTLAVLPDTQYYVSCREKHFARQSQWLAQQLHQRNIAAVFHLGDLTEHNTEPEWLFVQDALAPLAGRVPLLLATGNHDYGSAGSADRRTTLFSKYFSPVGAPTAEVTARLKSPGDWENAYYRIPLRNTTLGVMILEWSPRTSSVRWANEVLDEFAQDRVIFITHAYLYYDGTRYDWQKYGPEQEWNPRAYGTARKDPSGESEEGNWTEEGAYDGEMLWQELLFRHAGVFLTLSGHVLGDGAGLLTERGLHGNVVHQVLANYQMLDEGGLGYLRLVEINEKGDRLTMKTYSPSLQLYATADDQSFSLPIVPALF